ncbi:probable serine/threonine-protein kinase SIS8 [Chenopodium quinoa]|uniref:probable serine/threonine-protein kinase SIS8 n=1 Tax=Chenopodium quinoa TaxID=63459 RepID=UPI000B775913|nr:probable serine/threonine-protein kinase SIS8 [Chenopodium quinoa]
MSKMKHLLRKLHIGNDHHNRHHSAARRIPNNRTQESETSTATATTPPSSSSTSSSPPSVSSSDRTVRESTATTPATENVGGNVNRRNPADFNLIEEDFQLQLAMAISASGSETRKDRNDDESDQQIMAAKQLSLACSPSVPDNERLSEFVSLKYWNYNVVQYDEKVVDGFYDVYAVTSHSVAQGEMPLLVDLQAVSISSNVEYEVVLVNRSIDAQLQQLENKVYAISVECKVLGHGMSLNDLIQSLANLVVDRMGGPVANAEEITKRWRVRSNQLKASLNTIVLPLGCLDVGLSRHRALLFKVLADKLNLPCMLVKGSLYTGTDEGAVNLIKYDDGSEYIIDLMGAPGALIPSEVPSSLLLDTTLEARGLSDSTAAVNNLSLVLDKVVRLDGDLRNIVEVPEVFGSNLKEAASLSPQAKQVNEIAVRSDLSEKSDYTFEQSFRPEYNFYDCSPSSVEEASLAQEKKVKDVSKYVISAAKDPEFAQKLHAVLLESGASPPADLFMDMSPSILRDKRLLELIQPVRRELLCYNPEGHRPSYEMPIVCNSGVQTFNHCEKREQNVDNATQQHSQQDANAPFSPKPNAENTVLAATESNKMTTSGATGDSSSGLAGHDELPSRNSRGKILNQTGSNEEPSSQLETAKRLSSDNQNEGLSPVSSEGVCPMLGEFAEWEIRWEDLQIGERIGIGSYGEVYRADWNGTEVAVKKFLVQDLTGDVLVQFKCEAEMMIRLRHPNVVLFMGAVTRSPNLSILTEFIPRGSLYRLLHRSGAQINESKRMKMALDVARGMNYLHTSHPTVVHRDLKSPNLLVDKNWVVKVCDFGLSRLKYHTYLSSNSTAGTPEWMAPEVLRNEPSNEKCDVYSFGVILWELVTLSVPWTGLNPMQVVGAVGFQNRRLIIPEEVDPVVAQIIRDCWENDPRLRPSFSQIISRLKGLHRLVVQKD